MGQAGHRATVLHLSGNGSGPGRDSKVARRAYDYRALWHCLAGVAALSGVAALAARARSHFAQAREAASGIRWLANLARYQPDTPTPAADKQALEAQIERLEGLSLKLGTLHEAKYAKFKKSILDGLASSDPKLFEPAQRDLGELLGFRAGKHESD
jgi:hypothetical protein